MLIIIIFSLVKATNKAGTRERERERERLDTDGQTDQHGKFRIKSRQSATKNEKGEGQWDDHDNEWTCKDTVTDRQIDGVDRKTG